MDRTVNKLVNIWLFAFPLKARNRPVAWSLGMYELRETNALELSNQSVCHIVSTYPSHIIRKHKKEMALTSKFSFVFE